jgi:hypothetical protein
MKRPPSALLEMVARFREVTVLHPLPAMTRAALAENFLAWCQREAELDEDFRALYLRAVEEGRRNLATRFTVRGNGKIKHQWVPRSLLDQRGSR